MKRKILALVATATLVVAGLATLKYYNQPKRELKKVRGTVEEDELVYKTSKDMTTPEINIDEDFSPVTVLFNDRRLTMGELQQIDDKTTEMESYPYIIVHDLNTDKKELLTNSFLNKGRYVIRIFTDEPTEIRIEGGSEIE